MINEKQIWQTKEFRDAKEKAVREGKIKEKCEWCGSKEILVPHHKVSFKSLLSYYSRLLVITEMSKEEGFKFTNSALAGYAGFNTDKGYIKKSKFIEYMLKHPELKEPAFEMAKEKYLAFEDIETLCKRCHRATEKGMVLCEYCKKKYHRFGYASCWDCKPKAEAEYREFEERMDAMEAEFNRP